MLMNHLTISFFFDTGIYEFNIPFLRKNFVNPCLNWRQLFCCSCFHTLCNIPYLLIVSNCNPKMRV